MATFFLACFVLGGVTLVVQLAMGLAGFGGDHDVIDHDHALAHDGLDLLSLRALAAGAGFFGITGYAVQRWGAPAFLAAAVGVVSGLAAATGIAWLMRGVRRLEVDKSLDLALAIGVEGKVHLTIPAQRSGAGKVLVVLHDRLLELPAVTSGPGITSGTAVLVTDLEHDMLVVAPSPPLLQETDDVS